MFRPQGHHLGLGLRTEWLKSFLEQLPTAIDFVELAPENWMGIGGQRRKQLQQVAAHYPIVCHGLSLSLGGRDPLDWSLLSSIKAFLQEYQVGVYSEHLSFCQQGGHLYDLIPLPFTEAMVARTAERIRQVQDFLGQRIAIENISYYQPLATELSEAEFLNAVLAAADCELLLDVNNVYVNSINHGYDAVAFLKSLPAERLAYLHIAGHEIEGNALLLDTHGAGVAPAVWQLLTTVYQRWGMLPTVLERDLNPPPLSVLIEEVEQIRAHQPGALQGEEHG